MQGAMPPSHHTDDLPFPPLLQVTDPFHGVPDSAWKSKTMPLPLFDIPSVSDSGDSPISMSLPAKRLKVFLLCILS